MSTYKQIQAQIEKLQAEAEEVRKNELASAINQIKAMMSEFGITVADLGLSGKKKTVRTCTTPVAKYRNPATGDTWSGRGKAPKWFDPNARDQFLIK
jgi:DNA-binding protein H-NS